MRAIIFALVLGAAATASAQETATATATAPDTAIWQFGVAPRLGVTKPTSKLGLFVVGALELDYRLPVADKRLVLALDVSLTRPSYEGTGTDPRAGGAYDYTIEETELKVGLDAVFRLFTDEKTLVPFIGAGPILHMLRSSETTSFGAGPSTHQDTNLGLELLAGADYRLGPGYLLGEVRVVYSNLAHVLTGDVNAGNVVLGAGYRLTF